MAIRPFGPTTVGLFRRAVCISPRPLTPITFGTPFFLGRALQRLSTRVLEHSSARTLERSSARALRRSSARHRRALERSCTRALERSVNLGMYLGCPVPRRAGVFRMGQMLRDTSLLLCQLPSCELNRFLASLDYHD